VDEALAAKLITEPSEGSNAFGLPAANNSSLLIERLSAMNTPNPSAFFKHMLGWNRKAMRLTLLLNASEGQVRAAEVLAAIGALRATPAAAASTPAVAGAKK
jgi:hypothetical protein